MSSILMDTEDIQFHIPHCKTAKQLACERSAKISNINGRREYHDRFVGGDVASALSFEQRIWHRVVYCAALGYRRMEEFWFHDLPKEVTSHRGGFCEVEIFHIEVEQEKLVGKVGCLLCDSHGALSRLCDLDLSTTQQTLKKHFSRYGNLSSVDIILERPHQLSRKVSSCSLHFRKLRENQRLLTIPKLANQWLLAPSRLFGVKMILNVFPRFGAIVDVGVNKEFGEALIEFSTAQTIDNLRKRKFNHIIDKYYLITPGNDGTCRVV
ncbi:hypothetical protein TcWFU_001339 [Taenia crassiceps]|uniref:Tudor domain-containing protein n=1 Tax=Taenia crassiceps TaxID=6207 RepID=A0ABR4Q1D3_9CEST